MRRTPPAILVALFVTALLATSPAAAEDGGAETPTGKLSHLYFDVQDGTLVLSPEPPLIREPGTWSVSGYFDARRGLRIEVPVENPHPDAKVMEDAGVAGWIDQVFTKKSQSATPTIFGPSAGSFSWSLVEGSQTSRLVLDCRYNDVYYCGRDKVEPRYLGTFPGHGDDARPHRHGNQTAPSSSLRAGEFSWILAYEIPPCASLTCSPLSSTYSYTWTLRVDGTTFVQYYAESDAESLGAVDVPPPPEPPQNATDNTTAPEDPQDPESGNATSNTTSGQGSSAAAADPSVRMQGYRVEPKANASALPLLGVAVAFASALGLRRRS